MISVSYIAKVSWDGIFNKQFFSSMFSHVLFLDLYFFSIVINLSLNLCYAINYVSLGQWLDFLSFSFNVCKIEIILLCSYLMRPKWHHLCKLVKCLAHSKVCINLFIICFSRYMKIHRSNFSLLGWMQMLVIVNSIIIKWYL